MNDFVGTGTLVRLALRRDRVLLPIWIVVFAMTAAGSAKASMDLYTDPKALVDAAQTSNASPALVSLYGRIFDESSLGEVSLFKLTAFGALLVGLLGGMLVVRHTRSRRGVRPARAAECRRTRSVRRSGLRADRVRGDCDRARAADCAVADGQWLGHEGVVRVRVDCGRLPGWHSLV